MSKRHYLTEREKNYIGRKCANCGAADNLQYHHIVPLSMGGNDILTNMVCLCGKCHSMIHHGKADVISHNEAVRAGIRKAQARGVKVGRPDAKNHEKVMQLIAEKSTQFNLDSMTTEPEIMTEANVCFTVYHQCKRKLLDAMKLDKWPYTWPKPEKVREHPLYEHLILRLRREGLNARDYRATTTK